MTSMLRMEAPKVGFANLGPRCALPIPAPSGRPLTKGALIYQGGREGSPGRQSPRPF